MRILQSTFRAAAGRVTFAALLVLLPAVRSEAAVQSMVVPVRGMTCALCTRGVEESIRRIEGVGSVVADLATGKVSIEAAEGKSLDIQQVKQRVVSAGFATGGEVELSAVGRFTIGPQGRLTFRINGTNEQYQVLESSQLRHLFIDHPGLRGDFLIGFRLHDHPGWKPAAMSISSFEARPSPPILGR